MPNLRPRLAAALDPFGQPASRASRSSETATSSRPSILSASPPTSPITTKPASASRGPDTMNPRPGASPNGSSPSGRSHRRADTAGDAALGERDRDPALGDVVGALNAPERTRARTAPCAIRILADVGGRQLANRGRPRSFDSSDPAADGSNGPTSAITSPSRANPSRPARAAWGSLPTIPTTGVGKIGPAGASL